MKTTQKRSIHVYGTSYKMRYCGKTLDKKNETIVKAQDNIERKIGLKGYTEGSKP